MKKFIWSFLMMSVFAFTISSCSSSEKVEETTETTEVTETTETTEVVAEDAVSHTCSMHPDEKGKAGDKCSKCGMDLTAEVKKTE